MVQLHNFTAAFVLYTVGYVLVGKRLQIYLHMVATHHTLVHVFFEVFLAFCNSGAWMPVSKQLKN